MMNLEKYRIKKAEQNLNKPHYRTMCSACSQPDFSCYCQQVKPFDSKIDFVVLIHPIEAKRRIATGRMSHQCLKNSHLVKGQNYTEDKTVNTLITDSNYHSMILYPGATSKNLSMLQETEKENLFPKDKKLRIFVIDGTWATARKMIRQSENLKTLPRICFSPTKPSTFRVRKQPHPNCYSTIEAIHHTIELVGESQGFSVKERLHDNLLHVFDYMVERQLGFIQETHLNIRKASYRRYGQQKVG